MLEVAVERRVADVAILDSLQDGETIEAGDDRLLIVHTPGHAPDHICLWHEVSRRCSAATCSSKAHDRGPGGRGGNLRLLRLAQSRRCARAARRPAGARRSHFGACGAHRADGAHRAVRERQVVAAIAAGADSVAAIATGYF
jgi:glyoxylase-like metal-dependent hydrolase (beta-lactamase superfamily II)